MVPVPPRLESADVLLERSPNLIMLLNTPKGRGVFASASIPSKTVIEVCPVIVLPPGEVEAIKTTQLNHYTYNWPFQDPKTERLATTQAVVLGLGSMFNHSSCDQNVAWDRNLSSQSITYKALRDIEKGEELCINYGRLWFADADAAEGIHEDELDALNQINLP